MNTNPEREYSTYFRDTYKRGVAEGVAQGRIEALQASLRHILQARGLSDDAAQFTRIEACDDDETLERWITQAVTAESLSEALR